jgi:PAS domain S-box-containing protein
MDNDVYFVPPAEYLSPASSKVEFERMLSGLAKLHDVSNALTEAEQRFRTAVDLFPSMYIIFDPDLRVRFINRRGLEELGVSADTVVGKRAADLLPYEVALRMEDAMKGAVSTRAATSFTWRYERETSAQDLESYIVPVEGEDGEVAMLFAVSYDNTEREQLLREISSLSEQLSAKAS